MPTRRADVYPEPSFALVLGLFFCARAFYSSSLRSEELSLPHPPVRGQTLPNNLSVNDLSKQNNSLNCVVPPAITYPNYKSIFDVAKNNQPVICEEGTTYSHPECIHGNIFK